MKEDSCGPSWPAETPGSSNLAYCRRLPSRSCKALTTGVNTNDAKLCDIVTPLAEAGLDAALLVPQLRSARKLLFIEKLFYQAGDFFAMRLERKMTRIDQVGPNVV
jgi:hypothetical protein